MTATALAGSLYAPLIESVRFPASLAFVQFGRFHRTSEALTDLVASATQRGHDVQPVSVLAENLATLCDNCSDRALLVIDDLDSLLGRSDRDDRLEHLRPCITSARTRGARVLLLSRASLGRYPTLNGSSILLDASEVLLRAFSTAAGQEYLAARGISDAKASKRICEFASGSRGLLEAFALVETMDGSSNAKRERARELELQIAVESFSELGPDICSWLEHWVFECRMDQISVHDAPDALIVSLRMAGCLTEEPGQPDILKLLPIKNRDVWIAGLGKALSAVRTSTDEWMRIVRELFRLERDIRLYVAEALEEREGTDWAAKALAGHLPQIIELAKRDTSPLVQTLADVRSPLDWLTLGQLLDLASAQSETAPIAGHSKEDWDALRGTILPTRNRVAHMRLARDGDWDTVRKARLMFDLRLSQTTSRST